MNLTDWQILAFAAFFSPIVVTGLGLAASQGHWAIHLATAVVVTVILVTRVRRHQLRAARTRRAVNGAHQRKRHVGPVI